MRREGVVLVLNYTASAGCKVGAPLMASPDFATIIGFLSAALRLYSVVTPPNTSCDAAASALVGSINWSR